MRYILTFFMIASLVLAPLSSAFSFQNNDFRYWPRIALDAKINKQWNFVIDDEARIGDNTTALYHNHIETGFNFAPIKYLMIGSHFRYTYSRKTSGPAIWSSKYWPVLLFKLKYDFGSIDIGSTSRFEFRVQPESKNWWYRNRIEIKLPYLYQEISLRPYIANEFFINLNQEEFNKNRSFAGIRFKPVDYFQTDIYYMRDYTENNNKWNSFNVFGTIFKFLF